MALFRKHVDEANSAFADLRAKLEAQWTWSCPDCDHDLRDVPGPLRSCPGCGAPWKDTDLEKLAQKTSTDFEADTTPRTLLFAGVGATIIGTILLIVSPTALICSMPFFVPGVILWPSSVYQLASNNGYARGWGTMLAWYHFFALAAILGLGAWVALGAGLSYVLYGRVMADPDERTNTKLLLYLVGGVPLFFFFRSRYNPYWVAVRKHWQVARRASRD